MSNSETSIPHKIVDTLLTANIIAKDFSTYVDAFSPMRSDWTAAYAVQLSQRRDDALSDLGVDHRAKLRKSTDRVFFSIGLKWYYLSKKNTTTSNNFPRFA